MSDDATPEQMRRRLDQLDASLRAFGSRQAGHHLLLRALLATHPNRAILRAVLQEEAKKLTEPSATKLPPELQEAMSEEIVAWLALLA